MKKMILMTAVSIFTLMSHAQNGMQLTIDGQKVNHNCGPNENAVIVGSQYECYPKGSSLSIINGVITVTPPSSSRDFSHELSGKLASCLSPQINSYFGDNNCDFGEKLQQLIDSQKIECANSAYQELNAGLSPDESVELRRAMNGLAMMTKRIVERAFDYEYQSLCNLEGEAQFVNGKIEIIAPSIDPILNSEN